MGDRTDRMTTAAPAGRRRAVAVIVVAVLVLAGFAGLGGGHAPPAGAAPLPFTVQGSVEQVAVTDLSPRSGVELLSGSTIVASGTADAQGAFLFRSVAPGSGYRVRSAGQTSTSVSVTGAADVPPDAFYSVNKLKPGYGYLTTRDGTKLSVNVTLPRDGSPGPWPVVVDYSGYDPSQPGDPPQEALPLAYQGYVVVGVNVRGTGCSGGAFNFFETLQSLDGYDVVETLARQSWSNGDVGLVGISYPGISQLFVAQTRPPHLRAITPLSVIADTYRSTAYPGGILNKGFALGWAADRDAGAQPAARPWVRARINGGDWLCGANQALRLQSTPLASALQNTPFYQPFEDQLAPRTFVDRINVPVYLAGQFQDEQTGGDFSTMVGNFAPTTKLKVTLTNGTHVEPLGPEQATRVLEFIDFYVGRRIPHLNPILRVALPVAFQQIFDTADVEIAPDRFVGYPSYGAALAAYEAEPKVRVLWENGAGRDPGEPFATAESGFADWPAPGTIARAWYLQPDGALGDQASGVPDGEPRGVSAYTYDPSSKPASTTPSGSGQLWHKDQGLVWQPLVEGDSSSFVTAPFATETALAGWGSVDLWLRSTETDTDLEATLTEVRPDGQERYIQSGWLRASHRAIDPTRSTELRPFQTHREADSAPLPADQFVPVRIALFPFAHVLRPGSRLRLNIESPGGNQPLWQFRVFDPGRPATNEIAHTDAMPSRVVLPVLPDGLRPAVPSDAPACPSLRNQPCRDYRPARVATAVTAVDDGGGGIDVHWAAPSTGGPVSEYRILVSPTGETATVAGDLTSFTFDGAQPGTAYSFQVVAVYDDTAAPPSSASLSVTLASVEGATRTAPSSPPPTPTGTPVAGTGSLPVTGASTLPLLTIALALLALGATLVVTTRRRRR